MNDQIGKLRALFGAVNYIVKTIDSKGLTSSPPVFFILFRRELDLQIIGVKELFCRNEPCLGQPGFFNV